MSIQWQRHFGYLDCFHEVYKIIELENGDIVFGGAVASFSGSDCIGEIGGSDFFLLKPTPSATNSGTKPTEVFSGSFDLDGTHF